MKDSKILKGTQCLFDQLIFCQLILLFSLFLLIFICSTAFFGTIYESHCTILTNIYLNIQYFQQKVFSFSKISESQTDSYQKKKTLTRKKKRTMANFCFQESTKLFTISNLVTSQMNFLQHYQIPPSFTQGIIAKTSSFFENPKPKTLENPNLEPRNWLTYLRNLMQRQKTHSSCCTLI